MILHGSKKLFAVVTALLFVGAACGGNGDDEGTSGGDDAASGQDPVQISIAMLTYPSMSSTLIPIIESQGIAEEHGFELDVVEIAEFGAYYTTIASGQADALQGGATVAQRLSLEGTPIQIGGTAIDLEPMVIVTSDPSITTLEDLEGKKLAAPVGSAEYEVLAIYLNSKGIDIGEDVTVSNAAPPIVVTELQRGRVDAGLLWEPGATLAIDQNQFSVVATGAEMWDKLTNEPGWDLVWLFHGDWVEENPGAAERWVEVVEEAVAFFESSPEEAAEPIAEQTGMEAAVLEQVREGGRMDFEVLSVCDEGVKDSLNTMFQLAVGNGFADAVPDDSIFTSCG